MLVFSSVEVSRFFIDYAYTFGGEFETNFGILEPRCMNKVMLLKRKIDEKFLCVNRALV